MTALPRFAVLVALAAVCCLASCDDAERRGASPLGIKEATAADGYDLEQIQEAGELIAATLSGPDTYYEYKGRGTGLQFELAESFANAIGTRLRMETARDTAELIRRLAAGDIDLIALEIPDERLKAHGMRPAGTWSDAADSSPSGRRSWALRHDTPLLAGALDQWYKPETKAFLKKREQQRLTPGGGVRRSVRAPLQNRAKGIISAYDALFVRHSQAIGWDWRLMAAQCYQESGFDPQAESWAGAKGLMQIMPATAAHLGLPADRLFSPEENIAAAARYLRELEQKFSDIRRRTERINFVLAAYNGGAGHVRDAMALARKHGRDAHAWADVGHFILQLSKPECYNDPVVAHGYMRGEETYGYVRSIRERWDRYRQAVGAAAAGAVPAPSRRNSRGGAGSKVLSAEELEAKYKETEEDKTDE